MCILVFVSFSCIRYFGTLLTIQLREDSNMSRNSTTLRNHLKIQPSLRFQPTVNRGKVNALNHRCKWTAFPIRWVRVAKAAEFFKCSLKVVDFLLILESEHDWIVINFSVCVPNNNFRINLIILRHNSLYFTIWRCKDKFNFGQKGSTSNLFY